MALSACNPVSTDTKGREMIEHGTALFPVACYQDDLQKAEVSWHWHEELEVFVVENGTARVCINGGNYLVIISNRGRALPTTSKEVSTLI